MGKRFRSGAFARDCHYSRELDVDYSKFSTPTLIDMRDHSRDEMRGDDDEHRRFWAVKHDAIMAEIRRRPYV